MSVKVSLGKKKKTYKSIREASNSTGIPYMTLYMRVHKLKWPVQKAVKAQVREYRKVDNQVAA